MDPELEFELQAIRSEVSTLEDNLERIADLLDTISDGLFFLNLHVGADVKPWLPDGT